RQLHRAIGETNFFLLLDLDAPRDPGWRIFTPPLHRDDLARHIALKFDVGLDRALDGSARPREETVTLRRIQSSHLARFIKRDKLIRTCEFTPQLKIYKSVLPPLIHTRIFTERLLPHSLHKRNLRRGLRARYCPNS